MLVNSTKMSLFRFSAIMSSGRFGELPILSNCVTLIKYSMLVKLGLVALFGYIHFL